MRMYTICSKTIKFAQFSSIVDRINNVSIVTGIEYPKSKWTCSEDEWEEYCKSKKELITN